MDGAVAIFDALAGVQAQTITVWNQAERYALFLGCNTDYMQIRST